jgi:hypothetical protein
LEGILVVDLSSKEEDVFPDTSRDEEFVRQLFDDHNCELLGPLGDGNIITLSGSDEEEEVREEDAADAEAVPSSAVNSLALTASVGDADDAPDVVQDNSSDGRDEVDLP